MKILSITAGAGGMICGSCLRDNALARELRSRGHDVLLLPIYTPTRTDEPNASSERVFFGGISVYLQQHSALFRKMPPLLDPLLDSRWLLRLASGRAVKTSPNFLGKLTVSMLKAETGLQHRELRKLMDWLRREPLPDVINLPNSLLIGLAAPLKQALHRPVCCTLQGEDLFLEGLDPSHRAEALDLIRAKVASVDLFLPVSQFCADSMSRLLSIPAEKICIVPLGITLEGVRSDTPRSRNPLTIGYLARIAPEKGLHVLAEAWQLLRQNPDCPPVRLEAAGYLAPEHRPYLDGIIQQIHEWGYSGEFRYHGVLNREQKITFLESLDVFSAPATYPEPKGLSILEALACGVPVVQPGWGAFPEILERTAGGLLCEPGKPEQLAQALRQLLQDPALSARLGASAAAGVRAHYTVAHMADRALAAYDRLLAQ